MGRQHSKVKKRQDTNTVSDKENDDSEDCKRKQLLQNNVIQASAYTDR